ncbi:MAG: glutathione S-transferase N-terminal domain-containing protein [Nitrospirae bacterium]|nr:glutathione S-transferase N-terminal domain-containing protein [Nitrospirota bacterium]
MAEVVLYTVQGCGYCRTARELLRSKGVPFEERDITYTPEVRDELAKMSGGERSVPQIYIDGQYMGQDDELRELIESGRLDEMR